ncbi:hypothetical protein GCM10025867_00020 [Frondihabitans sucicola]|uniref:Cation/H+ exchanger domain-containing protein n=1 Tax=Frondihabitans sucicola TaxID=1268041 RepID=A0ABN6XVU7_9MICO|nr:hypothetical protein [Frondihabitans sucicola]BDZ47761.1 hypothetical protein GCM10025867_00020 [Frondihabitans sucicola]
MTELMIEVIAVLVIAVLAIAAATAFGPKVGVATPLLLVVIGIGVGLIPMIPNFQSNPELLLLGVLPPCSTRRRCRCRR